MKADEAGRHRIRIEFADRTSLASLALRWGAAGSSTTTVPNSALSPRYDLATTTTVADSGAASPRTTVTTYAQPPAALVATSRTVGTAGGDLISTYSYDAAGRLASRYSPLASAKGRPAGSGVTYAYASAPADNPCTEETVEEINQGGALAARTSPAPAGVVDAFVYDPAGRPLAYRSGPGGWTCTTYDTRGRIATQRFAASATAASRPVIYTYSALSTTVADSSGSVSTTVDLAGRVVSSTDAWESTATTIYDPAGRASGSQHVVGGVASNTVIAYDANSRPASVSIDASVMATPTYDPADGALTSVAYANGVTGTFGYDPTTRATSSLAWSSGAGVLAANSRSFTRSRRVASDTVDAATTNYAYDPAGRLSGAGASAYGFATSAIACVEPEAARNTNRSYASPPRRDACYDGADRLVSDTAAGSATYDPRGNVVALGTSFFGYDGADRHHASTAGTTTVDYRRDATGRIISRQVNGGATTRYGYDGAGDSPSYATDASGNLIERYFSLPGGVLVTKRASGDVWSYPNLHGDVMATADGAGAKIGPTFTYDPYGNPTAGVPDNAAGEADFAWVGSARRFYEHAPGLSQIETDARLYDPGLGRFLSVDPVEGGSCNDYEYVCGDPVNLADLSGECIQVWQARCRGASSIWSRGGRLATRTVKCIPYSSLTGACVASYYGAITVNGCLGPACITAGFSQAGGRRRVGFGGSWSISNIFKHTPGVNALFSTTGGQPPSSGVGASLGGCFKLCSGVSTDGVTGSRSISVGVGTPGWWVGGAGSHWWDIGDSE